MTEEITQTTLTREDIRDKKTYPPPKRRERRLTGGYSSTDAPATDGSSALKANTDQHRTIIELHREIQQLQDEKRAMAEQLGTAHEEARQHALATMEVSVAPQMAIEELVGRDTFIRRVINEVFKPGVDFGPPFPGSDKVALWKTGAEKLTTLFTLAPDFIEVEKVFERASDSLAVSHIRYEYRCNLHFRSLAGPIVGTAIGVCSTEEEKYKYRKQERECPECGEAYIYRSKYADKETQDKGWYCYKKKGGCGAQFKSDDPRIVNQTVGRDINPDMGGLHHTIAAMAQKRAFVLAVRLTTGVSAYFDEDVAEEEPTTTAVQISADLIAYAETLLPPDHGYSKSQIGKACLNALGMTTWADDYDGTLDDAKRAIAQALNKTHGNGETSKTAPKSSETGDKDTEPATWQKSKRNSIVDEPEAPDVKPEWALPIEAVRQFVNEFRDFMKDETGQLPNYTTARKQLIEALGLQGTAKNNEELQSIILGQYSGTYGDAKQAYALHEWGKQES